MDTYKKLAEIFADTEKVCQTNEVIKKSVEYGLENVKFYDEKFRVENKTLYDYCIITVENERSLNSAERLLKKYKKVAVLNFADPYQPGGLVREGEVTQEECLCRCSTLYPVISDKKCHEFFYNYHMNNPTKWLSERIIYVPDVTVFKTDEMYPQMREDFFNVDIITSTAPIIVSKDFDSNTLYKVHKSRIKNIFESAIDNGAEAIVVGAFGCGAFNNPPEVVANAFYDVIVDLNYDYCFKEICLAVLAEGKSGKKNYEIFSKAFENVKSN